MKSLLNCPSCLRQLLLADGNVVFSADLVTLHCPSCGTTVRIDMPEVARQTRAFSFRWQPAKKETDSQKGFPSELKPDKL